MTKLIKYHFFNHKQYAEVLWKCSPNCKGISSIQHMKICNEFKQLRENRNIEHNDEVLVHYFQDLIVLLDEIETR